MKKIVSLVAVMGLSMGVADAAPSYLTRTSDAGYRVTYDYTDKAKTGWYVGGRASLSLLNWENEYSTEPEIGVGDSTEDFSEVVYGGNVFVGRTFKYFWRAEVEAGLIGQYDDADQGYSFKLTVPYLVANGYYDFANGFYAGAGLGIALPKTELDDDMFVSGGRSERSVSPMGALMFGYTHKLDYNLVLDVRYRLAGFMGTEHKRVWADGAVLNGEDVAGYTFKNDIGLMLDNSFSVGVRYEF
jgi:hypothetical protein